jgi:hypothetical protein
MKTRHDIRHNDSQPNGPSSFLLSQFRLYFAECHSDKCFSNECCSAECGLGFESGHRRWYWLKENAK